MTELPPQEMPLKSQVCLTCFIIVLIFMQCIYYLFRLREVKVHQVFHHRSQVHPIRIVQLKKEKGKSKNLPYLFDMHEFFRTVC